MQTMAGNQAIIDSWVLSLHGKAPGTIQHYVAETSRFARWLEANGRPAPAPGDLLAVTRHDVRAWLTALKAAGVAQATQRNRWVALRALYNWLVDEDEVDEHPLAKVTVSKPSSPAPNVISEADAAALLKVCEGKGFNERRDYALLRFMMSTGLRVSEVCGLAAEDIDLRNRVAHVRHGKGDRARLVRFDPVTAAALDRYKRERARHRLAKLEAFWIGHRGALTRKGVPNILDKRAAEAGIGHIHAHQFRHTWADRWLAQGGTEGDLLRLGGWQSAEIMRRYGEARAVDRSLDAYDRINPMGKL